MLTMLKFGDDMKNVTDLYAARNVWCDMPRAVIETCFFSQFV